jgi:hypothetical protein
MSAQEILLASQHFTISVSFFILFAGIFGHIIDILIFTSSKPFRKNQSAFYLTTESIVNCIHLLISFTSRIAMNGFANDLTQTSIAWCKLRNFFVSSFTFLSLTIVCFAAIDQYLSTNHQVWLKQLSTLKLAHRLIYSSIIVWIAYGSVFLIFFDLRPTAGCAIYNIDFSRYYSFFHFIALSGLIPIFVSSTFSLLAYFNVRRIIQRRTPVVRRKLDKQLTAMVLAKVVFLVVTILPSVIFRIYILNVTVDPNDSVRIAIHELISNIAYALFYIDSAVCNFC